jgi:hypothetical protein
MLEARTSWTLSQSLACPKMHSLVACETAERERTGLIDLKERIEYTERDKDTLLEQYEVLTLGALEDLTAERVQSTNPFGLGSPEATLWVNSPAQRRRLEEFLGPSPHLCRRFRNRLTPGRSSAESTSGNSRDAPLRKVSSSVDQTGKTGRPGTSLGTRRFPWVKRPKTICQMIVKPCYSACTAARPLAAPRGGVL